MENVLQIESGCIMSHFKRQEDRYVLAEGIDFLKEDPKGYDIGNDVAVFSKGRHSYILVNMRTGRIRQFVSESGRLLVEDKDIDYECIHRLHKHYQRCADTKSVEFYFGRYNDFKEGLCALCWTTYPDGMYFADSDGFGMEDNDEETVYCIINTDFEILVPFRPMKDVDKVLCEMRRKLKTV